MVLGASIPRPRSFNGKNGWSDRTTKPKTKRTVLKSSRAPVYCFQFCGPLFSMFSTHRKGPQGRYFPSIIQERYLLNGIASRVVTIRIETGKNHIMKDTWLKLRGLAQNHSGRIRATNR